MNQQDKAFMTAFSAVLGVLVVIAILCYIIASAVASSGLVRDEEVVKFAMAKRIAPVGRVVMAGSAEAMAEAEAQQQVALASGTPAGAGVDMSAEEIYNASCNICHGNKVPNAPQLGDTEQWQPRFDKGLDQMVHNALNGINTMPAKGGNADLSEQNIKDTVIYMLQQSGFDVPADTAEAPASSAPQTEEKTTEAAPAATEAAAPATTEAAPAATEAAAPATTEAAAAASEAAPAASGGGAIPQGLDLAQGETVYKQACSLCHDTGAANAPKLGDKNAWGTRLGQDFDTLAGHAIKGLNAMPAKGGRADLSDDEVTNAVAYMLESVK